MSVALDMRWETVSAAMPMTTSLSQNKGGPKGARLTKYKVLIGYILAQYIDGDDEEPTRSDCVDLYIENALEKLKAYLYKITNTNS